MCVPHFIAHASKTVVISINDEYAYIVQHWRLQVVRRATIPSKDFGSKGSSSSSESNSSSSETPSRSGSSSGSLANASGSRGSTSSCSHESEAVAWDDCSGSPDRASAQVSQVDDELE